MNISKEELIEEITDQLDALSIIADAKATYKLSETFAFLDLQFRLKCKLYELTQKDKEGFNNQIAEIAEHIKNRLYETAFNSVSPDESALIEDIADRIDFWISETKEGAEDNE